MILKKCNYCLDELPINHFGKDAGKRDGLKTICRNCRNSYNLEARFKSGDSKVEECDCGKLFINESFVGGPYNGEWKFFDKCRDCSPREKVSVKKEIQDNLLIEIKAELDRYKRALDVAMKFATTYRTWAGGEEMIKEINQILGKEEGKNG